MIHLLLSAGTVQILGWALLHFIWQGLFLAALLNLILPLCRSALARHNWALTILAAMASAPVLTFLYLQRISDSGQSLVITGQTLSQGVRGAVATMAAPAPISLIDWLVVFWLAGIAVLSLRALGGWCLAEGLRRRDALPLPVDLLRRCHALQQRLSLTWPVRFLQSGRVSVPVVIGWFRPVVLIPIALVTGLAPQQLDALILHELAHIRRLDAFTNILLVAVETLLFYHPAVWWVSRRIRIEREHCCDDMAVRACGDAALYVEALTALPARKTIFAPVLAANGGTLQARAARLLGLPSQERRFSLSAMTGLIFLSLGLVGIAATAANSPAHRQDFAIRVVDENGTPDQSCDQNPGRFQSVDLSMGSNGFPVWNGKALDPQTFDRWLANVTKLNRSGQQIYFRIMAWDNADAQKLAAIIEKRGLHIIPVCGLKDGQQASGGEERVPVPVAHFEQGSALPAAELGFEPRGGEENALWLKREGGISGNVLADARVGASHGKPIIDFRLTPEASKQFGALTKANVGRRLAVVVNGTVITAPRVLDPILGGRGEISGSFDQAQAQVLVAQMMGMATPK